MAQGAYLFKMAQGAYLSPIYLGWLKAPIYFELQKKNLKRRMAPPKIILIGTDVDRCKIDQVLPSQVKSIDLPCTARQIKNYTLGNTEVSPWSFQNCSKN